MRNVKSVTDVTCSSQILGLMPKGDTCQDVFISRQQGILQGCGPLGTIYFSHKWLDMNQFCQREKTQSCACLKNYCSLVQYTSFTLEIF